ncbi:MAG: GTP 3',8-cyclase MoaA [Bryobacteraceae bacterium]
MTGPVSLRVSVTDRCALRCVYCAPSGHATRRTCGDGLSFKEIAEFSGLAGRLYGLKKIRITGGEPLIRPEIESLVAMLAAQGTPDLALTTDGQRLAATAEPLKRAGLRRVNVSLDSLESATFASITHGGVLEKTLGGIEAAQRAGLAPVKLNMVVLRGMNDHEPPALVRFAMRHGCQARFLELMPIGEAAARFEELFVPSAEVLARLETEFRLTPHPTGPQNTSRDYVAEDGSGRRAIVGLISPTTMPFCAGCRRLRLTTEGVLIGCLGRNEGVPLAPLLRAHPGPDVPALTAAIERALDTKRHGSEFVQPRAMVGIGG